MKKALAIVVLVLCAVQWASAASPTWVAIGVGVWSSGGRVNTLELVGLNPQPEPPSRPAIVLHTSRARPVVIRLGCTTFPGSGIFVGTGKGSDGRWYQVLIDDNGVPSGRVRDGVAVVAREHPPSPCARPSTVSFVTAGDFVVR